MYFPHCGKSKEVDYYLLQPFDRKIQKLLACINRVNTLDTIVTDDIKVKLIQSEYTKLYNDKEFDMNLIKLLRQQKLPFLIDPH